MSPRPPLTARRLTTTCGASAGLLLLCSVAATSFGAGNVTLWDAITRPLSDVEHTILFEIRLPRVLLSGLLGGALTVAGVVFQALLRNPLADPYVLGVSGGASIGGVAALLLGFGGAGLAGLGLPAMAFAGALGALLMIERVATVDGRLAVYTVLLTGAIFNAFSAAIIYFVQSLASLEELHAIVFYLMGHIPSISMGKLPWALLAVGAIVAVVASRARELNALSLGEEGALQLGVDVERLKRTMLVLGSLLTGIAVSLAGMIGFVGLIVPHVLRLILGPDHRLLLPSAFFSGASFLIVADAVARTAFAPGELPVGVVTALIGGPFFLVLLRRRGGRHGF